MANHKSSIKRIRQIQKKRLHNKYYAKTARNAVRKLRSTSDKAVAIELLPKVVAMLDKLAKRNIIHKNKAGNLKSKLTKLVNKLA
ncbi:MAG: 30S ribosomal protein S20 [Bacteroidales bacterium]|nr:MAG: 30S ribosomal protein S20 [Bacteroidales bacterium]